MKDYYAILGVDKQATDTEIKKAYRKLASQHHPDRGGDASKFKEIQEAYEVLGDASKRAAYSNPQGFFSQRHNFDDILNQYFTQFDVRSQMRNSRVSLWVSLEDAVQGGKKLVTINTGHTTSPMEIVIPQGIHDEENVRYSKLAPGGMDLVVNYRVHGHPVWQRDGLDLLCEKEFDFWQLILGTEVAVKTLLGNELTLKVPAKTKPGSMLRLKGQGIQRQGHNTGDVFIKIKAVMPANISEELIDILSKHVTNK